MALFHMLVVAILAEGTPLWDDNCDSCEAGSAFLQLELSKDRARVISSDLQASRYWFPTKSVDNNRSGQSSVSGPFPLHKPDTALWELNVPGVVFHQVPMIDDKLNIYMGSDAGKIFSFDKYGAKRWEVNGTGTHCQDPSLFEGTLYTACRDGSVLALDMMTGQLLWQRKICKELPFEHYSISVTKDHIFLPAGVDQHGNYVGPFHEPLDIGSPAVALLRREDGRLVWKANLSEWNAITGELTPCMLSDSVIFSGGMGSTFRLSLQNGSLIWKVDVGLHRTTNAQVSCTQDGKVFAGYGGYSRNDANDRHVGGLYALDIKTGDTLWTRSFPYRVYTPVAVGGIQGHAGTAIIVAMGTPGMYPNKTTENHTLWALDANTGDMIWSFNTPSCTAVGARGGTLEEMCWPLAWSAPVISKDGIVYINWAFGGVTYALRDINKDGLCDLHNPEEVSSFDFGIGHQGGPALAPGMLVVLTCHGPRAILTAAIEQ